MYSSTSFPPFFSLTTSLCISMVASGSLLVSLKWMFLVSPWDDGEDEEEGRGVVEVEVEELKSPS